MHQALSDCGIVVNNGHNLFVVCMFHNVECFDLNSAAKIRFHSAKKQQGDKKYQIYVLRGGGQGSGWLVHPCPPTHKKKTGRGGQSFCMNLNCCLADDAVGLEEGV